MSYSTLQRLYQQALQGADPHIKSFGVAIVSVAIAVGLKLLVRPFIEIESPFLFMFAAVIASALWGGLRAGVLATISSALISYYLFLSPTYTFLDKPLGQNVRIIMFLAEALFITQSIATLKSTQRRLKSEQASLRDSEERNRLMIEAVQDYAIFMLDPDGHVASWNIGAQRIKGYRADEIIGQHFSRFYLLEDAQQGVPNAILQEAIAVGRVEREGWRVRKDGSQFWANSVITALRDEAGNLKGFSKVTRDITQRKQTEANLHESEDRFRSAIFNAPLPIMMHTVTGEVLLVNDAWTRATGYTHADIPTLAEWAEKAYQERKDTALAVIKEVYQQGKRAALGEFLVNTKFGTSRIWDFHSAPLGHLPDGTKVNIAMAMDVTERKQAEDALRESERGFHNLADSMPQLVWTANPDGTVDYYNQRVHEFDGFLQKPDGTWQWQPVLHPDDEQRTVETWLHALETGELYECEHRVKKVDGGFRWHLSRGVPVKDHQDQICKWYGTATDIHAQKQYQAEREELLQREQAARAEAEAASRMKDEFLATLSHELRTPMNAMLGWTVMLRTRQFDKTTTARALETIERNTRLLHQLIEDILDISRIVRGKIHLDMQSVSLVSVLESALDTVKATAEAKQIQISHHFDSELAIADNLVWGDPARLQQIFWNLLANAVKFTPQGGSVSVQMAIVSRPSISGDYECHLSPDPATTILKASLRQYAQIQISDNGIGIDQEFLPYVFERFRQADGSITRSHGGLGLGLAIVRQLVELHGGIVKASSAGRGQGAKFTVYLPLSTVHPSARMPAGGTDHDLLLPDRQLLNKLRVLVVDDELDVRELLTVILQDSGMQVTAVASAEAAFEAVQQWRPDVLVSDISMPEEDGYSLMSRLQTLPANSGRSIPAIALTAYASQEDTQKALAAGFQQHIAKPINPNQLIEAIANLSAISL